MFVSFFVGFEADSFFYLLQVLQLSKDFRNEFFEDVFVVHIVERDLLDKLQHLFDHNGVHLLSNFFCSRDWVIHATSFCDLPSAVKDTNVREILVLANLEVIVHVFKLGSIFLTLIPDTLVDVVIFTKVVHMSLFFDLLVRRNFESFILQYLGMLVEHIWPLAIELYKDEFFFLVDELLSGLLHFVDDCVLNGFGLLHYESVVGGHLVGNEGVHLLIETLAAIFDEPSNVVSLLFLELVDDRDLLVVDYCLDQLLVDPTAKQIGLLIDLISYFQFSDVVSIFLYLLLGFVVDRFSFQIFQDLFLSFCETEVEIASNSKEYLFDFS